MSLRNNSILVTGGAGFIGSHLVDRLISEKPEKIIVVDNFFLGKMRNLENAKQRFPNLKIIKQDASYFKKMQEIITKYNIEIVFNLAVVPLPVSFNRPKFMWKKNILISLTLCELIRKDVFKSLIHFSSSEVYGTARYIPMDENHTLNPKTPYAASKSAEDHLTLSYWETFGIDTIIVRPFNNYGPRQNEGSYAGVIPLTIKRILNNKYPIIYGDGNQTRDYIFVKDTVEAVVQLYKKKIRHKVVNIASGKETKIKNWINNIAKNLKWGKGVKYSKERPADVRRHCGDISLLKKLIRFQPKTNISEGLKKTINWYKKHMVRL